MSRPWRIGIAVAVVLIAGVLLSVLRSAPKAADTTIIVAGDVQAPLVTMAGPSISYPVPDFSVGLPATSTTPARPAGAPVSAGRQGSSRQPVVSGVLTAVLVSEGSRVDTGEVVAQLDTRLLEEGVVAARASHARTLANAAVLDNTLRTLANGGVQLATAKAALRTTLTQAAAGRAALAAQLAALEAMIPSGAHVPTPTVPPAPPTPQQLIARLKAAIAQLDAGIAKMRAGLVTIARGGAKLSAARVRVRNGRDLLLVLARGQESAVDLALAKRDMASVRTQVSGLVVFAAPAGSVVMVGAPIVRVVPDVPVRVDTYLATDQLARIKTGGDAYVDFDSNPGGPLHGRITRIGDTAEFPPTSFPTGIVHLTRTVLVTITLDRGTSAPAGTPVDVTLPIG